MPPYVRRTRGLVSKSQLHSAPGGRRMAEALAPFLGTWPVMMAAMMLPSATPMILLHRLGADGRLRTQLWSAAFIAGYLLVWASVGIFVWGAGIAASAVVVLVEKVRPEGVAFGRIAGALLIVAAVIVLERPELAMFVGGPM